MQKFTFEEKGGYFSPIVLDDDFPYSMFEHKNGYHSREQMHAHDCIEIGICTGGSGLFFIGGGVWPFMEGSISVIAAGTPHIAQNSNREPSEWRFINVGVSAAKHPFPDGMVNDSELRTLLGIAIKEFMSTAPDRRSNIMNLIEVFLSLYGRLSGGDRPQYCPKMSKILPALERISRCFAQDIPTEDLAKVCFLNPNYFRGLFRSLLGCTPTEYINRVRLRQACLLLKSTSLSVTEVSERAGFVSLSTFNRLFKRVLNSTPTLYRKEEK